MGLFSSIVKEIGRVTEDVVTLGQGDKIGESLAENIIDPLTGKTQRDAIEAGQLAQQTAAEQAIAEQQRAAAEAQGFLDPTAAQEFIQAGTTGAGLTLAEQFQQARDQLRQGFGTARGDITGGFGQARQDIGAGFGQAGEQLGAGFGQAHQQLAPFGAAGQAGLENLGVLTDPAAQMEFLQNNPLFQLQLDNLNQQALQQGSARGRLASGDTLKQLQQNAILAGAPLLQQQQANVRDLLGLGVGVAGQQGQLSTGLGGAQAGLSTGQAANLGNLATGQAGILGQLEAGAGQAQSGLTQSLGQQQAGQQFTGAQNQAQIQGQFDQAKANAALGLGSNVSNLLTDIGNVQAAGALGQANARGAGVGNIINLGTQIGGALSGLPMPQLFNSQQQQAPQQMAPTGLAPFGANPQPIF